MEEQENKNSGSNQEAPKEEPKKEAEASQTPVDKEDAEKNKGMAILAYIVFFIPILAAKESKFAMYHANQGLLLFLLVAAIYVVGMVIPFIGWFLIIPLGNVAFIVLAIMGIINASKGEMKELPLIGKYRLL